MLSKENIEKICKTGLYSHKPEPSWRSSVHQNDLFWCFNWTFKPRYEKSNNTWYMVDTYYGDKYFELTDENFEEFKFMFDFEKVHSVSNSFNFDDYDESDYYYNVAVDSGGRRYGKSFIKNDAKRIKSKVIERYEYEIAGLERQLKYKKEQLEKIKNDKISLDYV